MNHSNRDTFYISGFRNIPSTYSGIETLWKLSELCQGVAEQHVRMGAVEQNTDYCLGGAGVVDDLEWQNTHSTGTDVKNTQEAGSFTHDAVKQIIYLSEMKAEGSEIILTRIHNWSIKRGRLREQYQKTMLT